MWHTYQLIFCFFIMSRSDGILSYMAGHACVRAWVRAWVHVLRSCLLNAKHTSGKYRLQAIPEHMVIFFLVQFLFGDYPVPFRYSTEDTHFITLLKTHISLLYWRHTFHYSTEDTHFITLLKTHISLLYWRHTFHYSTEDTHFITLLKTHISLLYWRHTFQVLYWRHTFHCGADDKKRTLSSIFWMETVVCSLASCYHRDSASVLSSWCLNSIL